MKRIILSSMMMCLFILIGHGQTVHPHYLDGAIWVKLKNTIVQKQEISLTKGPLHSNKIDLSDYSFYSQISNYKIKSAVNSFPSIKDPLLMNVIRIEFEDIKKVDALLEVLESNEIVEYAERVPYVKNSVVPNDPYYTPGYQWSLFKVNAEAAWNISTGSAAIKVAIIDDAVEITHPDLAASIYTNTAEIPNNGIDDDNNGYIDDVNGYDVANDDNDPSPDGPSYAHGTHVAGIAGATTNNGSGVASIGHGISIVPIKATNSPTVVSHGYEGIYYAIAVNADVINMSWGGPGYSQTGENLTDYAHNNGAVLVAAAGNDDITTEFYPAAYSNVIAVASTNPTDGKSYFSNYGTWIDISAPGSDIASTTPGGEYEYNSGTSMASPMVAGLAGLMLSHNPGLTPAQIKSCILTTATDIYPLNPGYSGELGSGRIDALAAMTCVDATLNNTPSSDFSASSITLLEGQTTTFTDLTTGNPTTWTWSFTGGVPATYTGQIPPAIAYSAAGSYTVSLTTSNTNGTDTETKTGYIDVNSFTGCDTITNTIATDVNSVYSWGPGNGAMFGHNYIEPQYVAEKYTSYGPTYITGSTFNFTDIVSTSASDKITIKVWEDAPGVPGNEVYSQDVILDDIVSNITPTGFFPTNILFDQPVSVTTTNFYVGFELYYTNGEVVELSSASDFSTDATRQNSAFYYVDPVNNPENVASGWVELDDIVSGDFETALHIYPTITNIPPTASITASSITVCEGETIQFDGAASQNASTYDWTINGSSTPNQTGATPSVIMNTVGTHNVSLLVQNSCGFEQEENLEIEVTAQPNVSVSASQNTICISASVDLTASGATSYTWTPTASLSCSNCPDPTATPTSTTTYSVEGTTGGCSSTSSITISVDNSPVNADFTMDANTICEGETLTVNGSSSTGAQTYNWTFNGGTPTSNTGATSSAVFDNIGSYMVVLEVENSCGVTHKDSLEVTVLSSPVLVLNSTESVICPSQSTGLTATGANTYVWSPSGSLSCTNCPDPVATPTSTTTYSVVGSNGTCSSTETITIQVDNSPLNAAFTLASDTVCVGDIMEVDASSSVGAQSYNWTFNGGTPSTASGVNTSTIYAASGTNVVQLEIENLCNVTDVLTKSILVISESDCTTSLISNENDDMHIFFNAEEDRVEVNSSNKGTAYILNTAGQKIVDDVSIHSGEAFINTKSLSKGLYILVFDTQGGTPHVLKFVK